ncbi:MAG TPA: response regulator [Xanthobacteraceae bacterium]|nr:response regulator [Xanthobacteraceae bacterium]
MKDRHTINLGDLVILIADPNSYLRRLIFGMLRGFGANKLLEVDQSLDLLRTLTGQKIDILLCDARFPPHGGLSLTKNIRRDIHNENRTIPILIMSSDGREATIKSSRDAGANMVIAKPISPKVLYDRLAWIAFSSRKFVDTATYFGPDRRFKIEGYPNGVGRRKEDKVIEVAEEVGPALGQDDIDSLFTATRIGQS